MLKIVLTLSSSLIFNVPAFAQTKVAPSVPDEVLHAQKAAVDAQDCRPKLSQSPSDFQVFDLGNGAKLYLVNCQMAMQTNSARGYITTQNSSALTLVQTSEYDSGTKALTKMIDLPAARFDNGTLSTEEMYDFKGTSGQAAVTKITVGQDGKVNMETLWVAENNDAGSDGDANKWPLVYGHR